MFPEWRLVREWRVNGVPHRELINQRTGERYIAVDEELLRKAREPKPHPPRKTESTGRRNKKHLGLPRLSRERLMLL